MRQWVTKYFAKIIWLIIVLLLSSGCQRAYSPYARESERLPQRVLSVRDPGAQKIVNRLNRQGVTVISMGQNYLVSIPAALLFAGESPRIRWESYAVLNDVVCYLNQFRKIGVDVSAFSSQYVSPSRERALTSARARVVADYLWSQDIDSRFVFTRGLGSDKPIISAYGGGDRNSNARVEITFRNAVA